MHAAALFQSLGDGDTKKFFQSLVDNDVKVLSSNGEVRRRVANGKFAIGLTDTDDVNVAIQEGKPLGSGMEEIYQITSALKFLKWGREVAVVTDARFSGVSTGACIGHVGPEALAGGPIGKLHDGDLVRIIVDRNTLDGTVDLVGDGTREFTPEEGVKILANRSTRNDIQPDVAIPCHAMPCRDCASLFRPTSLPRPSRFRSTPNPVDEEMNKPCELLVKEYEEDNQERQRYGYKQPHKRAPHQSPTL